MSTAILWFRDGLRLDDHPALRLAVERHDAVVPLYILEQSESEDWPIGAASRWWLHHSLTALSRDLRERGSRLVIARGHPGDVLQRLLNVTGAEAVYAIRRPEPSGRKRDQKLSADGAIPVTFTSGNQLLEPDEIRTGEGKPYRVFTPFWKRCQQRIRQLTLDAAPDEIPAPSKWPKSMAIDDLGLLPTLDWADGFREDWRPGEEGAMARLLEFAEYHVSAYSENRDRPDLSGTSRLSPHLHFGEISPRRILAVMRERAREDAGIKPGAASFVREVGWREFSRHLLHHFPHTTDKPLNERFSALPWRNDVRHLKAWQRGATGIPLVDAGMRQLWATGWMHNRVRMVVASFLTKNLRLHWLQGARWFFDTLVDADLANNTQGWQWTAGCGADAAPYFRIFNPVRQSQRFDPNAEYITRWVPELASLPAKHRHAPWEAPDRVRRESGFVPGETYPEPLVDLRQSRQAALDAYEVIKG